MKYSINLFILLAAIVSASPSLHGQSEKGSKIYGCLLDGLPIQEKARSFREIKVCKCEHDYIEINLISLWMSVKKFEDKRTILGIDKAPEELLLYFKLQTPLGYFESLSDRGAFQLNKYDNRGQKGKRNLEVYEQQIPILNLAGPFPSEPGDYTLQMELFLTDQQEELQEILLSKTNNGEPTGTPVLEPWIEDLLLSNKGLSFDVAWNIPHDVENRSTKSEILNFGYKVFLEECASVDPSNLFVSPTGIPIDSFKNSLSENYFVMEIKRVTLKSVSNIPEVQAALKRLNYEKMMGINTQKTLKETFAIIDQLPLITHFERYYTKLNLADFFGQSATDIAKLNLETSTCDFIPPNLTYREALIILMVRQELIASGVMPPGAEVSGRYWKNLVESLGNDRLWPLAARFSKSDIRLLKEILGSTYNEPYSHNEKP